MSDHRINRGATSPPPPTSRIASSELAGYAAMLDYADAVLWVVDGGFIRLTREDLPAIRAFLDGDSDSLSLSGGLLPAEVVKA